jgi:hypothetical protein
LAYFLAAGNLADVVLGYDKLAQYEVWSQIYLFLFLLFSADFSGNGTKLLPLSSEDSTQLKLFSADAN